MGTPRIWPGITSIKTISTLADIAPWPSPQYVAGRLTSVAGNPITGNYSVRFKVQPTDKPLSTSGCRNEVFGPGGNGNGSIPLDVTYWYGHAFTAEVIPTIHHCNFWQMHGAVNGSQPCLQVKADSGGQLQGRTNPDGTNYVLAGAGTWVGKLIRTITQMRPSLGSGGIARIWVSIDGGPYTLKMDYTGRVGFAATYPKIGGYGADNGNNYPWSIVHHGYWEKYASYAEVESAMTLAGGGGGGGGNPPPPPPPPPPAPVLPALPGDSPIVPAGFAPGSLWTTMGADVHRYNAFVMPEAGTISSIVAGIDGNGGTTGTQNLRAVLGNFATLTPLSISTGQPVTNGDVPDWVEFPLLTPQHVSSGQVITLGLQSGTTGNVARYGHAVGAAGSLQVSSDLYSDGVASPWTVTSNDAKIMAIYAKYVADTGTANPGNPGVRSYAVGGRGYVSGGRAFVASGRASNGLGGFGA